MSELHARSDSSVFGSFLATNLRLAWALTIPIALGCGLLSPVLVRILFGSAYGSASLPGTIMSLAALLMVLNAFINASVVASGRMWQAFGMTLSWALLFVLCGLIFIPAWGTVGAAATFLVSYVLYLAVEFTYWQVRFRYFPHWLRSSCRNFSWRVSYRDWHGC